MSIQNNNPDNYFSGNTNFTSARPTDEKAQAEAHTYQGDLTDIEIYLKYEKFKVEKNNQDSERQLREKNAHRAFVFSAIWALFVAVIIVLHASCPGFVLTQTEFLFVIGSLTVSILTYYLLVIKYLFYRPISENTTT